MIDVEVYAEHCQTANIIISYSFTCIFRGSILGRRNLSSKLKVTVRAFTTRDPTDPNGMRNVEPVQALCPMASTIEALGTMTTTTKIRAEGGWGGRSLHSSDNMVGFLARKRLCVHFLGVKSCVVGVTPTVVAIMIVRSTTKGFCVSSQQFMRVFKDEAKKGKRKKCVNQ